MSIFEFAMKMEEDGRAYYLEHAEKTSVPAFKRILTELAEDELRHYNIFKAMRDAIGAEYKDSEKTGIVGTVKNVFDELKSKKQEYSFNSDVQQVWQVALEIEKKAEAFYREKAEEVDDEKYKEILRKIADEEHNHWLIMENVLQFLDRPQTWLEDAEWNNLEPF